jgi:hypothetical protein
MKECEWQKIEISWQVLVTEIINDLHRATKDDVNYEQEFNRVAQSILTQFVAGASENQLWKAFVRKRVEAFTDDPRERNVIYARLLDKLLDSVRARVWHEYYSHQLLISTTC